MKDITATITPEDSGRAIKYYIRSRLGISYHGLSVLKATGGMFVNGVNVHANHVLREGDTVSLVMSEGERASAPPEAAPVHIAYEDTDIMIIDKEAPMACQCSDRNPSGTLENRLAQLYPDMVFRPLNRLDRGTSGLMCAAKHAHAYQILQKQLHTDAFVREYLAVCEGVFTGSGTISAPIAKAEEASVKRVIDPVNGRHAVTHYSVVGSDDRRTVVRLRLETGRTHQIRVHLSHIGHPIVGDFLYGTEIPELPGRFALHSAYIRLTHPMTGETVELTSKLPEQLKTLCNL